MKKLAGVAVFAATLGVALLVTSYYTRRPVLPPVDPPHVEDVPPAPPAPPASRTEITYKVQLVTLDVAARKSHTTLTIEHAAGAPAPQKLWVWTGFFVPGDAGGEVFAGEPVLVERPFASGSRRATVNVSAACPWCGQRDAPAAGYYAHVNVSTASASDARLDEASVSRDLSRSTQVTVEEGHRKTR